MLRGDDGSRREWTIFGINMCPSSIISLQIANWTDPCSGVHTTGAEASLQALDESVIGRVVGAGWDCTPRN